MKIEDARKEVFRLRPHFASMIEEWGEKTLLEYYAQDFSNLLEPSLDVLRAVETETTLILGKEIAKQARQSLERHKWVNTADHHGLLCHPYFYTAALARSRASVTKAAATVTLPFGGISLGNDSFPRGFSFHDAHNVETRIFFKSLEKRRLPVYSLKPMDQGELMREYQCSLSFALSKDARERMAQLFSNFKDTESVWNQPTYSAQLTALNSVFWKTLFGSSRGDFVYLQIDSVVNRLLLEKHLKTKTPVFDLLFNTQWREAFVELFSGVTGSHTQNSGTQLFWYIDHEKETRRRLLIEKDTLVTLEHDVCIPLSPESIAERLQDRTLMPSSALLLIIVHGVEKLACAGGPSQLSYLSHMMQKWQSLLRRFGQETTIPATSIWCGDNTLFEIAHTTTSESKLATLVDLFLYEKDPARAVDIALSSTSIAETVDAMTPMLYGIYTKQKLQQDFLFTIPKIFLS